MKALRDRESVAAISDPTLHGLIEKRVKALDEYEDYDLAELVTFIVIEPGDTLEAIDVVLGRPVLGGSHELIEAHAGYYEMVFVLSDDGYGIEVFVPTRADVPPELLALCVSEAQEATDR